MDDFELQLQTEFLDEADQMMGTIEQLFLQLEGEGRKADASGPASPFGEIARLSHNIKGTASAYGFEELSKVTHELESLILRLKKGEMPVGPDSMRAVLASGDRVRELIQGLKRSVKDAAANARLRAVFNDALEAGAAAPKPAEVAAAGPAEAAAATSPAEAAAASPAAPAPALAPAPAAPAAEGRRPAAAPGEAGESIRVSLERIDRLINNVGEMMIAQGALAEFKKSLGSSTKDFSLRKMLSDLEKVSREIQQISMSLRMVPLKQVFQKVHRVARDTSKTLGKQVEYTTSGEDLEIDRTILERLGDPMVHLIRNAVDHGLESTEDRVRAGKPGIGRIHVSAERRGGAIVIEIRDDGRGMSPSALIAKAIEKGLLDPAAKLTDQEAYGLIFIPGFSTKTEVSDISGRGVGMDVVRANINALQGAIEIDTHVGKGTTFRISLPLTLAVVDGMVVRAGTERFVVPLTNIAETLSPKPGELAAAGAGALTLRHRGETMPAFRLEALLGRHVRPRSGFHSIALIIRGVRELPFSLLVDEIVGRQQVVIKPLGKDVEDLPGLAGGAILGDGRIALILDIHQVIEVAA